MSKRVFILDSEDLGSAIVDYVRKMIGETPETDLGKYSFSFISDVSNNLTTSPNIKVKRLVVED